MTDRPETTPFHWHECGSVSEAGSATVIGQTAGGKTVDLARLLIVPATEGCA